MNRPAAGVLLGSWDGHAISGCEVRARRRAESPRCCPDPVEEPICEAVLLDALAHGIFRKQLRGSKWGCVFAKNKWIPAVAWPDQRYEIDLRIRKSRNLYWLIEVAAEEGLVRSRLKRPLHKLRDNRNNVHLAELAAVDEKTGLNMGKEAYRVMHACIECVAHWMTLHP